MTATHGDGGKNNLYHCSFCGKPQGEVKRLIAGPDQVYICDECVGVCTQILTEQAPDQQAAAAPLPGPDPGRVCLIVTLRQRTAP